MLLSTWQRFIWVSLPIKCSFFLCIFWNLLPHKVCVFQLKYLFFFCKTKQQIQVRNNRIKSLNVNPSGCGAAWWLLWGHGFFSGDMAVFWTGNVHCSLVLSLWGNSQRDFLFLYLQVRQRLNHSDVKSSLGRFVQFNPSTFYCQLTML